VKTNRPAEGSQHAVYQVRLPVSKRTLDLVGDLIRRERNRLGTRWRKAAPGAQALIVLAVLRHDQRLSEMAGGSQVSASTVRRWVLEVLRLLAARAPRLDRALNKIAKRGGVVVLLDGTLVRTRRRTGVEKRKNYSGKHKSHGLLFLALTDEKGNLIWISSARPGRSSEITTARHDKITAHLGEAGLGALADLGFVGLDDDPDDHIREPEVMALPHQDPYEHPTRDHPPAGPPRPREHRSTEVTDDLPATITLLTGTSTPSQANTSTMTCKSTMKTSQC